MNIPVLGSRIDSVTVYRQGALVSRTAIVLAAQPVPQSIKLVNLPLSLDDGSVRVRVEGEGDLPVASDVRVALDLAVADETLPPPDDEALKRARRDVAAIAERIAHLRAQRRRLERLQLIERPANKRGAPPLASPVKARLTMLEFRHKQIAALDERIAESVALERRAVQIRQDLEHRFKAASKARQARPHELRKAAIIALRARQIPTAPVRIILEYMVPGARWAPSYAISIAKDMASAVVSVRAVVAQSTGEDWTGVKLTLATADAQRWIELPELQALRIGRRQPQPARRGWRAPPIGAGELYADYDRFLASTAAPAEPSTLTGGVASGVLVQDLLSTSEAAFEDDEADGVAPARANQSRARDRGEMAKKSLQRPEPVPPPHAGGPQGALTRSGSIAPPRPSAPPMRNAPPPAPGGAPMPAVPMQAQTIVMSEMAAAPKRGGGLLGATVGAIGGLVAGALGGDEGGGGGGPPLGYAGAPGPEPEHEAAPEQLAYGDLRMPGPKDGRRGALVVSQRRERYLEMLFIREVTREIDVVALIDGAVHRAGHAGSRGLPPRHTLATSWGGFDYVYAADSTVDIPSDDDFHGIPLMSRPAGVELGYVVVPRESTDVFRHVKLHNPLDAPLLPGPADIYVGGDYLLSCDLRVAPPRGELKIGLGVEQAVKVSRNTHFVEESHGMLGGTLALRHEIHIEVANRRDRPVALEVQERVPTLREKEDEIQFDLAQVDPPWQPYDPEEYPLKGGHRWQVQLQAGETRKLRATYVIKISAKKELHGGNRREL